MPEFELPEVGPLEGEQKVGPSGDRPLERLPVTDAGREYDGLTWEDDGGAVDDDTCS